MKEDSPRLWLIDAGNSAIKLSRYSNNEVERISSIPRQAWGDTKSLEDVFSRLGTEQPGLDGICCACARQGDKEPLTRLATLLKASTKPVFVKPDGALPFEFIYTNGQPGPDRLANAAGLMAVAPGSPAIAIDFGTATHVEVVDGKGAFSGGVILPGLGLQFQTLSPATEGRLPHVAPNTSADIKLINNSTEGAIRSGIFLGQAAIADKAAMLARKELDCLEAPVFLTGGGAPLIAPLMSIQAKIEPALTMTGLARIWVHVQKERD